MKSINFNFNYSKNPKISKIRSPISKCRLLQGFLDLQPGGHDIVAGEAGGADDRGEGRPARQGTTTLYALFSPSGGLTSRGVSQGEKMASVTNGPFAAISPS